MLAIYGLAHELYGLQVESRSSTKDAYFKQDAQSTIQMENPESCPDQLLKLGRHFIVPSASAIMFQMPESHNTMVEC